jgi:hypothetical protein
MLVPVKSQIPTSYSTLWCPYTLYSRLYTTSFTPLCIILMVHLSHGQLQQTISVDFKIGVIYPRITIQYSTNTNSLSTSFRDGIFFCMKTDALPLPIGRQSAVTDPTPTFIAIFEPTRRPIIPGFRLIYWQSKNYATTYPVETMRFSRTRTAPTRRFMQFDRCEASDASV